MFTSKEWPNGRGADDPRERISASSPAIVYRREVLKTPIRALEAEIGISRTAIDHFHKRKSTPGKNWPKLRDWYVANRAKHLDEYRTPPELMVASALQILSLLPGSKRTQALTDMAGYLKNLHVKLKEPQPEWVKMLTELADKEADA
ncbi:MAG TPA: hypothetical protein VFJ82_07230 [Longimicrobium sp.]|nr:hypothetical protein [Longimicrobium sp.]